MNDEDQSDQESVKLLHLLPSSADREASRKLKKLDFPASRSESFASGPRMKSTQRKTFVSKQSPCESERAIDTRSATADNNDIVGFEIV